MSPAKSSDLAARLKASAAGSRAVQAETPSEPTPVPAVEKHESITRIMVKMPKAQHRFIRQFALESDTSVSSIIRLLLTRIENDPVFAEDVRSHLANGR
jgi:hypothetical protein